MRCLAGLLLVAARPSAAAPAAPVSHPTLSTNWVGVNYQPGTPAPAGYESYHFVDKPRDDDPSGLWSNYSDVGCKRLIRVGSYDDQTRYYLKCDAVDCCKCDDNGGGDDGNQIEFQIPNVHPAWLAPVTHTKGEVDFPESGRATIPSADFWHWKFGPASYYAVTQTCAGCNVSTGTAGPGTELLKWKVDVAAENITIEFYNYSIPEDNNIYAELFDVPSVCQGNIVECCNQEKKFKNRGQERLAAFYARHGLPGNQSSWV
jgi:hypothetical protein